MAQWHYKAADGRSVGPLSSAELKALADSGRVTPSTPIRQSTGQRWVPASQVKGLFQQEPRPAANRAEPTPRSPLPRPDVAPAPDSAPSGSVARRLAGIPLIGWAAISVLGTIAVGAIVPVVVLLGRNDEPPPQKNVAVEQPAGETPIAKSVAPVVTPQAALPAAQAQIEKPQPPVEQLVVQEPQTPPAKETQEPPPPRPDTLLAEEEARKKQAEEEVRKKQAADQARALEEAQKSEAKRLELSRLNERIGASKVELAAIDKQGTALTTKRGEVFAQAAAADATARKVAGQIAHLEDQINRLNRVLSNEGDKTSDRDENERDLAMAQLDSLKQNYAGLQATYTELDTSARELKAQLEPLLAKRPKSSYALRRLQIQYDQLLRGPSSESARDAATAKAWRQVKHGMRTAEVENLLGKPARKESERRGQLWSYNYLEAGTSDGIVGTVYFVTGKIVSWEQPPWASGH